MVFRHPSAQLDMLYGQPCGLVLNPTVPSLCGPHALTLIARNGLGAKTDRVVDILRRGNRTPIVIPSFGRDKNNQAKLTRRRDRSSRRTARVYGFMC